MIHSYLKYCLFLSISMVAVILDQMTKLLVHTQFELGEEKSIIPGFFNLKYIRNQGGVFGLFAESHDTLRMILFLILPAFAFVVIFFYVKALNIIKPLQKHQLVAFSFITGGAIGNYIDRIRYGYVVDFLDFYIKNWAWPTFNMGDSFIVIGVFFSFYLFWLEHKHMQSEQSPEMANPSTTTSH